jgi:tartrate/fumarate subfamily iron-sulfur-dependent hydro-lyase beta chain
MAEAEQSKAQSGAPAALAAPCDRATVEALRVGTLVDLSGTIITGRDRFHKYLACGGESPVALADAAIYHCGPIVAGRPGAWQLRAAGPTTSLREEPYMAEIIRRFGVRVIIGKGGMGAATQAACRDYGCVYLQAVGGGASIIAAGMAAVEAVYLLAEFGAAEAVWVFRCTRLRAAVTIDAHGNSLYEGVERASRQALERILVQSPFVAEG